MRLSAVLEDATTEYAKAAETEAENEVAWKRAEANSLIQSEKQSEHLRKAEAMNVHAREFYGYKKAAAVKDAISEKLRTVRAQLDSLRTLSANLRQQT